VNRFCTQSNARGSRMHRALSVLLLAAFFLMVASTTRWISIDTGSAQRNVPAADPRPTADGSEWRGFNPGWLGLAGLAGLLGLRNTRREDL
jgi:MYXO-CTERM domain-containing protein